MTLHVNYVLEKPLILDPNTLRKVSEKTLGGKGFFHVKVKINVIYVMNVNKIIIISTLSWGILKITLQPFNFTQFGALLLSTT